MLLAAPVFSLLTLFLWFNTAVWAQGDTSLWAPWVPLSVRSPYLSTWMNTTNVFLGFSDPNDVQRAPTIWPRFLQGEINGWAGLIRIDDTQTYKWLGDPLANDTLSRSILNNIQVTPTRTIMTMTAGPLNLTATFLSPIEPEDPALQSLPFSYLMLEVKSNDGQKHNVQVYSDISGEWLSGNRSQNMIWQTQSTKNIIYHQLELANPQSLTEAEGQAEDATVFYAMPGMASQTSMVDVDVNCRTTFAQHGKLTNQIINPPHFIANPFPVFAISVNLGTLSATSQPVVWALGMDRTPAIGYVSGNGTAQQRSPYWHTEFPDVQAAMTAFATGYMAALQRATALDKKIQDDASSVSSHYADIVSLAARQAMGGTELTIVQNSTGTSDWSTSDVKMFMKDLGTSNRVNAVEGLYASLPFFLYINASYVGWLLDPIFDFASSDRWTFPYAPKDIGTNYPNAAGDTTAHTQGVEQSGNMLIMTLAHARATGDGSLIARYYTTLKGWAEYLVSNTMPLAPSQLSADTTDTASNLANLALKGIIGISAMSAMSDAMNMDNDKARYSNISSSYAAQWQAQAVSSSGQFFLTSLSQPDSSIALTYNLFADKLLRAGVIPSQLYASQTQALDATLLSDNATGLPVDGGLSAHANTAWSLFTAAYANDPGTENSIVDQIWRLISNNATNTGIFPITYNLQFPSQSVNPASPLIGGVFAPLSLNVPPVPIQIPSSASPSITAVPSSSAVSSTSTSQETRNVGAIVGGVVGGVVGSACLALLGFVFWRKRCRQTSSQVPNDIDSLTKPDPFPFETIPVEHPPPPVTARTASRPLQILSTKAREANARIFRRPPPSVSGYSSFSGGASSYNPPTELPGSSERLSRSEVRGLQAEVENLRRMIQSLGTTRQTLPPRTGAQPPQAQS